jgi:hypothetical protein
LKTDLLAAAIVMIGALSTACASTLPGPRLGSATTFDGLVEVVNARSSAAWMRPNFDLSGYKQVKLEGAGIEYRPVHRRARLGSGNAFPMSDSAKARLKTIVSTAFREELGRSERFELTEETGPDVLLVWGGLLDVVSFVPPTSPGRGDIFLRRIGEATLVVELRDSQTGHTLARILDRRAAEQTGGVMASNTVSNTAEVRRLANRWARLLRQRLDEAPTLVEGVAVQEPQESP